MFLFNIPDSSQPTANFMERIIFLYRTDQITPTSIILITEKSHINFVYEQSNNKTSIDVAILLVICRKKNISLYTTFYAQTVTSTWQWKQYVKFVYRLSKYGMMLNIDSYLKLRNLQSVNRLFTAVLKTSTKIFSQIEWYIILDK